MASATGAGPPPGALDVIFTCDVCQASISDIYSKSGPGGVVTDFQDGRPHTSDRRVTCLWLTGCMHLTCGRHLEGGGAPFHPKGEFPHAPCPYCLKEKRDARPKPLYAVRGLQPGHFDQSIPKLLFQAPPLKLTGQDIRMEALKFQYSSLVRYGTSMLSKYHELERTKRKLEDVATRIEVENRALTKMNKALKEKLSSLTNEQTDIVKWKKRMPTLTHYLKQWPLVMREVHELRDQLSRLGYAVPKKDYMFHVETGRSPEKSRLTGTELEACGKDFRTTRVSTDNTQIEYGIGRAPPSTFHPRSRMSANNHVSQGQTHTSESSSGRKRKLSEYDGQNMISGHDQQPQNHYLDHSGPQSRRRFHGHVATDLPRNPCGDHDSDEFGTIPSGPANVQQAQGSQDGTWHRNDQKVSDRRTSKTSMPRPPSYRAEKYLISGAGAQPAKKIHGSVDDLLPGRLESQTQKLHPQQVQQERDHCQDESVRYVYATGPATPRRFEVKQWKDRAILRTQSQSSKNRQPTVWSPTERNETEHAGSRQNDHRPSQQLSNSCQTVHHDPITPFRSVGQMPANAHVPHQNSSPFFVRGQGSVRSGLSPGVAGLSANARVGTTSRRVYQSMTPHQQDWSQPRSLNSLSFIDIPRGQTRNEPLYQARNAGTIRRNNANGPFIPQYPQRTNEDFVKPPEKPRLSSSYFKSMPPPQQISQAPGPYQISRVPPVNQSTMRPLSRKTFTRDDALNMVNKSRHHGATSFYQNQAGGMDLSCFPSSAPVDSRGLFSSTRGRRSVRR